MWVLQPMKLLTVRGVPILLDASWLLLLPLLLWSLAEVAMPTLVPELSRVAYWAMALTATAGLAASLLLREGAHLLTAERVGIPLHAVNLLVLGGVADGADGGGDGGTLEKGGVRHDDGSSGREPEA